jgi:hypothetical protein
MENLLPLKGWDPFLPPDWATEPMLLGPLLSIHGREAFPRKIPFPIISLLFFPAALLHQKVVGET